MKHLIILGKQYSKLLIRELVIMLMIVFIMFSLLDALSPLFHAITTNQYVLSALPDNTVYFYPSNRILSLFMMPSDSQLAWMKTSDNESSLEQKIDSITEEIAADGIGKTISYGIGGISSNTGRDTLFVGYNDDLIDFVSLPLAAGAWLSEHKDEDAVPIVVGGAFRDQDHLQVGDHISPDFAGDGSGQTDCIVVGILNKDDMYLSIEAGETEPSTFSLATLYKWEQNDSAALNKGIIIFPGDRVEKPQEAFYSAGRLFFFNEGQDTSGQEEILSTLNRYGHSKTIPEMIRNRYLRTVSINNNDVVISFSLFLFCILGLGGYTILMLEKNTRIMQIYRICGMTKAYGTGMEVLSIALMIIIPACLSLTQLKSRVGTFEVLNGMVYLCFVMILILILLPSVLYCICAGKHRSMMLRKE